MKGYIYKITNNINNKIYIGQTVRNIKERFREHLKNANSESKQPLYRAIAKYGKENFTIDIIEECNINKINEREIYYINKMNSYNNGYNATLGGEGRPRTDYAELSERFINSDKSMRIYCKENHIKESTLRQALNITDRMQEYRKRHPEFNCVSNKTQVAMIDKITGVIIKIFKSVNEAMKHLGISKNNGHINDVCKGKRNSAYGYKWQIV